MLKRLIEVALPLKEVSEQSAREKSIRHGHISTLHIWWARRPLAACRAVVFASLIPDPDDPECPTSFKQLVMDVLGSSQFRPTQPEPSPGAAAPVETKPLEDTPRNRCLEFIKHLVRWENSNEPEYIEPARKLIQAAHKILHPDSPDDAPKVLDPFAGGGAIPLEALRLGCEAHAIDINPVAHLIQLCTLVYPQKFGHPLPPDAPMPDYIAEAAKKNANGDGLFGGSVAEAEAEYRRNPLAADLKYWGNWVLERARQDLAAFYPPDPDGSVPVAYLWARTIKCANPACGATVPLVRQLWLCKKPDRKVALKMTPLPQTKKCDFTVVEGNRVDFDPQQGTMQRGQASCPFCNTVASSKYLQAEGTSGRIGEQMTAVVTISPHVSGKNYREPSDSDLRAFAKAHDTLTSDETLRSLVPDEELKPWSGVLNAPLFGLTRWGMLFNSRQSLSLATFVRLINQAGKTIAEHDDAEYGRAIAASLALAFDRITDYNSNVQSWHNTREMPGHTFGRQALPMVWDYNESNPMSGATGDFMGSVDWVLRVLHHVSAVSGRPATARRASATAVPESEGSLDAVVTDPPYYDAVPYSDLSDFFYVWQKRTLADFFPDLYRTPLTPKAQEVVSHLGKNYPGKRKTAKDYEAGMATSFSEMYRTLHSTGVAAVMFAHKTTSAWESVIGALIEKGLLVTSSWPFHTEMATRLRGHDSAALASSVTIICRKRAVEAGDGFWDDVRGQLREVANERLDFFWEQGIRGADFFISAIGPALSVFGRYERVVRLSGEEVTVGQFLDEVRDLVTHYALNKIVKGGQVGHIDAESQFYVVWKWSYADAKIPADEAFKLSQALGFSTEEMWDKTGVLEKSGQNVSAVTIAKRMKIKNLGEPKADGVPSSLIDVLHRLCAFRDKGDATGAGEFLARSGHGKSQTLWLVAQAVSEILPDGDKEKQLLQGLLNQRESLQSATQRLF